MSERDIPDPDTRRRLLTLYGRNAVREALADPRLDCQTLHLADSNRKSQQLTQLVESAQQRKLRIRYHSREALARISRNGRQDQGVALDVFMREMRDLGTYLQSTGAAAQRVIALDGVTNPQNLGMVIRSVTAAGASALLLPDKGGTALGPLAIKASAGSVFNAPLLRCRSLMDGLHRLLDNGFALYRLQANGQRSLLADEPFAQRAVFVLGGETHGVSREVQALPGENLHIPMANGVESLNVAVSAALVAYAVAGGDGVRHES